MVGMMRPGSRAAALTLAVTLALGAAGCTGDSGDDEKSDQPDPQDAAIALASGLTAKDLSKVALTPDTATTAQASYDRIIQELGSAQVRVDTAGVKKTGSTAVATLHWTWDLTAATWEYDAEADLKYAADGWQVAWAPSVVEPSLVEGENLDASSVLADRGDILGAGGQQLVSERQVSRVGIDKTQLQSADPAQSARALARLVGVDAGPFVKAVKAAGAQAFVEAIVFRREELPAAVSSGVSAIPGARIVSAELPLAPTSRLRGTPARQGRRGHGGDHRGAPGVPPRRHGRAVRARGEVRRAAARDARRRGAGRPREGQPPRGLPHRGDAGRPARALARHRPRDQGRGRAGGRRSGQRAGGHPAQHRRDPRRRQRSRQRWPEPRDVRPVRPRVDVQDRQQPGPAARRADARHGGAVHADDHGRRQAVQELQRLPLQRPRRHPVQDGGRQLVQHGVHLAGREAVRHQPVRRRRLARHGARPRPRLPGATSARPTPTPRARPVRPRS